MKHQYIGSQAESGQDRIYFIVSSLLRGGFGLLLDDFSTTDELRWTRMMGGDG